MSRADHFLTSAEAAKLLGESRVDNFTRLAQRKGITPVGPPRNRRWDTLAIVQLALSRPKRERGPKRMPTPGFADVCIGGGLSPDDVEFGAAIDRFKRESGRPFPTWSEVLQVLLKLGYRKTKSLEKPHS